MKFINLFRRLNTESFFVSLGPSGAPRQHYTMQSTVLRISSR